MYTYIYIHTHITHLYKYENISDIFLIKETFEEKFK